jgi:hypothetical protein
MDAMVSSDQRQRELNPNIEKMKKAPENIDQLDQIDRLVRRFYHKNPNKKITFHTLERTLENLNYCDEVLEHYDLEQDEIFSLKCAIYLSYCPYQLSVDDLELKSIDLAQKWLKKIESNKAVSQSVISLLSLEEAEQKNVVKEIFHDVMTRHFGSTNFLEQEKLLKQEATSSKRYTEGKKHWWQQRFIEISAHQYHTAFCVSTLSAQEAINLDLLNKKVNNEKESNDSITDSSDKQKKTPKRGVETMFRITSSNNQRLSDMADKKAHILITVNSIILSAIISLVLRKVDKQNFLLVPSLVLLANCLFTMIISILATRPKIPEGTFSNTDMTEKRVNLLYFGNFYKMPPAVYSEGMFKVMSDSAFLYRMLISDVYTQGVVLGRKYQLLRMAYNVFMYGLILSICCFILFSVFYS